MAEKQIEEIFVKYDVNQDGKLDKEEARKFADEVLKDKKSESGHIKDEFFEVIFSTIDIDNSGTLEKSEVMIFCKQILSGETNTITERLAMFAEKSEENQAEIMKAQFEKTFNPNFLNADNH